MATDILFIKYAVFGFLVTGASVTLSAVLKENAWSRYSQAVYTTTCLLALVALGYYGHLIANTREQFEGQIESTLASVQQAAAEIQAAAKTVSTTGTTVRESITASVLDTIKESGGTLASSLLSAISKSEGVKTIGRGVKDMIDNVQ